MSSGTRTMRAAARMQVSLLERGSVETSSFFSCSSELEN